MAQAAGLSFIAWSRRPNSPRRSATIPTPSRPNTNAMRTKLARSLLKRKTPDVEPADRRVTVLEGVDVGEDGLLQEEGERHRGERQVEALQPQRGQGDQRRRPRP